MFPIPFNFPFRKKDGSITSIGDAMGGGSYTLPTASAETKGGVKIGSGLSMDGEVLSATGGVDVDYVHEKINFATIDDFHYYVPLSKEYVGDGQLGFEISTNPQSSAEDAMIDIFSIVYENGQVTHKNKIITLHHAGVNTYSNEWFNVAYNTPTIEWIITLRNTMYTTTGTTWATVTKHLWSATFDDIFLETSPI